ncbi:MAG: mechanosensitive ion channel [Desulfobacterales bacterium]|nr:mechanosensitive ion channel [Desulfobacterales bacterium]MBF0398892.1 mechanosensitive ion channel [Desulfobacterales bacterium]
MGNDEKLKPNCIPFFCLLLFLCINCLSFASTTSIPPSQPLPWKESDPSLSALQKELESTVKAFEAIPSDASEDKVEGQTRLLLRQKIDLIKQLVQIIEKNKQILGAILNSPKTDAELDRLIAKQKSAPPIEEPDKISNEEFKQIKDRYDKEFAEVTNLVEEIKNRKKLMEDIPNLILNEKTRYKTSVDIAQKLSAEISNNVSVSTKNLSVLQIDNADITAKIAQEMIKNYEREQEFEKKNALILDKKLDLAKLIFKRDEQIFTVYKNMLNKSQDLAIKKNEEELLKKENAAKIADSGADKFVAEWEAKIARANKNIADLKKLKTDIEIQIAEQQKLLNTEKDEFKYLETVINQFGAKGTGAEILKTTFSKVKERKESFEKAAIIKLKQTINDLKQQRSEVDTTLYSLRERFQQEIEAIPDVNAEKLFESYKKVLSEEKVQLLEILTNYQKFEIILIERNDLLNDVKKFVYSKVFWIQDAPPLNYSILKKALRELSSPYNTGSFIYLWKNLFFKNILSWLKDTFGHNFFSIIGLFFFLLFLSLLIYYRIRLQNYADMQNESNLIKSILLNLLSASLLPIYLLNASVIINAINLNSDIVLIINTIIIHLAIFCFLWSLNLFLFSERYGVEQFGIPEQIAKSILFYIRVILISYFFCIVPWVILRDKPFLFDACPRLFYTLFEIFIFLSIYKIICRNSPLSEYIIDNFSDHFIAKNWSITSNLFIAFMIMILILDILGFRFGAIRLSINGVASIGTIIALTLLYRMSIESSTNIIQNRKLVPTSRFKSNISDYKDYLIIQVSNLLQVVFVLIGIFALAAYWGINEQAIRALNEIPLYSTVLSNGKVEFVTVSHLLSSAFFFFIIILILKHLPGIFELTLFHAMKIDSGAQYALLTISRYVFFIIGIIISLSFLKVDLGKLAWLVAAISVGIGFGLQEIFANFISGIIILIERPIKIGDRITIGNISGDITNINIRSTTVLNFDRQEILIPNKDFITKEVVNWTLNDKILRVVIKIGVAYGTDIDKVKNIIWTIIQDQKEILKKPEPDIIFMNHGASSLDFEIYVYIPHPKLKLLIIDRLNYLINKEFKENNVEIPFPQTDIHIKKIDQTLYLPKSSGESFER